MIDAEQVEHRRAEIVDLDLVLDDVVAELVGRAERRAALDAAAGDQGTYVISIALLRLVAFTASGSRNQACT